MTTEVHAATPAQLDEYEDAPPQATEEQTGELGDDEHPQTKSGVRNAREKVMQNAKYQKEDLVHMSVIANGTRSKGVFKVYSLLYNPAGWVDYQLVDVYTGQLYDRGAAVREKDLKRGT